MKKAILSFITMSMILLTACKKDGVNIPQANFVNKPLQIDFTTV